MRSVSPPPPSATGAAALDLRYFNDWLAYGERGISSEAIVSRLTGAQIVSLRWSETHPHDPDDFRRCQLLLAQCPLARLALSMMKDVSPEWSRLVDAWDEIDELIEQEKSEGTAPRAYRLMRRIIADGTTCTKCDGTGNAAPCEKCKGAGRRSGGRCRAKGCFRGHTLCKQCRGDGYTTPPRGV